MSSGSGSGSGASSGSSQAPANSGSEGDARAAERRRRRMQSNRESARRSRMRKQRHLDELTAQVGQLRRDNGRVLAAVNSATQHYFAVEAENSVLRTQLAELDGRLRSLTDILYCMNAAAAVSGGAAIDEPWESLHQPFMQPLDMFQYC